MKKLLSFLKQKVSDSVSSRCIKIKARVEKLSRFVIVLNQSTALEKTICLISFELFRYILVKRTAYLRTSYNRFCNYTLRLQSHANIKYFF